MIKLNKELLFDSCLEAEEKLLQMARSFNETDIIHQSCAVYALWKLLIAAKLDKEYLAWKYVDE